MHDAYEVGYDSFNTGLALSDNPYAGEAREANRWDTGWEDAKIEADLQQRSLCLDKCYECPIKSICGTRGRCRTPYARQDTQVSLSSRRIRQDDRVEDAGAVAIA
jgi:hypothetical protein